MATFAPETGAASTPAPMSTESVAAIAETGAGSQKSEDTGFRESLEKAADAGGLENDLWYEAKDSQPETQDKHGEIRETLDKTLDKSLIDALNRNYDKSEGKEGKPDLSGVSFENAVRLIDHDLMDRFKEDAVRNGNFATADAIHRLQHESRMSQVEHFANEKDSSGNPLRPLFEEVASEIAGLITASHQEGKKMTLQEAYDFVVWANPETRAKVQAPAPQAKASSKPKRREKSLRESLEESADKLGVK